MRKNVGARVQLKPTPRRIDEYGRKLLPPADDWIVEEVSVDGVRIKNVRTHYTTTLGKDHIYDYVPNPDQSQHGVKHGFLTLKVQLFLNAKGVSIMPTSRPGENLSSRPAVEIHEKWVDADYPARSGLKAKLETAAYSLAWAWDSKLAEFCRTETLRAFVNPCPHFVHELQERICSFCSAFGHVAVKTTSSPACSAAATTAS